MKNKIMLIASSSVTAILIAVVVIIFASPVFEITNVECEDAYGCTENEIEYIKNLFIGRNGLLATGFNKKGLEEAAEKIKYENRYIKNIKITYDKRHTVTISSEAREVSFLAEYYGTYLGIDYEGILLETYSEETKPDLPVITGLTLGKIKNGVSVFGGKSIDADNVIKLCTILKAYCFSETGVNIIDVTDNDCIWMYFAPELTVKFGKIDDANEIDKKVSKLIGILESEAIKEGTVKTVDISVSGDVAYGY